MSETSSAVLAAEIEAAVRAVVGVEDVYRTGSLVSNAIDAGARLLGARDADGALVRVRTTDAGCHVSVSIGVRSAAGAPGTARAVRAAVSERLAAHGVVDAAVEVTVVHVADHISG